jgi:hypothetical protein
MLFLRIGLIFSLFATSCAALNVHELIQYTPSIKRVQGEIVDPGNKPVDYADISVFNNPGVLLDESLTMEQQRNRQKEVFETRADENGKYSVKKLPKGSYELEFSKPGFDTLSVIVQIDPSGRSDKLCVRMFYSSNSGESEFQPCKR